MLGSCVVIFCVGSGLAGFPSAVMVVGAAGFAPRPIALTGEALMDISAIAFPEGCNVRVAAQ